MLTVRQKIVLYKMVHDMILDYAFGYLRYDTCEADRSVAYFPGADLEPFLKIGDTRAFFQSWSTSFSFSVLFTKTDSGYIQICCRYIDVIYCCIYFDNNVVTVSGLGTGYSYLCFLSLCTYFPQSAEGNVAL